MKSPLRRRLRSNGLTVNLQYATDRPTATWTAEGSKPLRVIATVTSDRHPSRKIYVTRATMRFTVSDGTADLTGPDPLVDSTNIIPGYLATSPYSYGQSFAVPNLDESARELTMDLKLELASLVDAKAQDFTKQTVTDTVHVVIGA